MMSEKREKKDHTTEGISRFLRKRDKEGNTLLHYVVRSKNQVFVEQLVAAGCDLNVQNMFGCFPITDTIYDNQIGIVKILLDAGADYESEYSGGDGPYCLHYAALKGFPDIVELLIKRGANVNICNGSRQTPLHYAAMNERLDKSDDYCKIIKMLVDAGAVINVVDEENKTPLLNAAEKGFDEGFELLLSFGADILIEGKFDFRFLFETVSTSELNILGRLFELGFDVNMTDENVYSSLHVAAWLSNSTSMEFLLNRGAVMNVNDDGYDPLCHALDTWHSDNDDFDDDEQKKEVSKYHKRLHLEHMEILDILIRRGANVNHVTNDGQTPLYIVLRNFESLHRNILLFLLKNGAKLDFDHPSVGKVFNNSNGSKFPHLLLRHTAMFKAQNREDGPSNFDLNNLNEESRKDYARCRDELELMKSTKIDDTNVSFFNVLVDGDIGPFTRNENIRNVFEAANFSKSFPIYSDLLRERFSEEIENQKLVTKATDSLGYVLSWDKNSSHILLSKILGYLDKKDLTNLALI